MENKIYKYAGILTILILVFMSLIPVMTAEARSPNYQIVSQGTGDYKTLVKHNLAEARAYCWEGTSGASDYRVVYVYLLDHNDGNKWYSDEYKSKVKISGGSLYHINDDSGVYSPYPRDDGNGYNSDPYWTIHNSIGNDMGAYVDVSTMWKYKDWDLTTGGDYTYHYQGHDYKDWETTSVGGCFHADNANYIKVTLVQWKMEKPGLFGSEYKTIADDEVNYLNF